MARGKKADKKAGNELAVVGDNAGQRLRSLVERIERLEVDKKGIADDIKEVYVEAKGIGFDTKVVRHVIKLRKMNKDDLDELETLTEVYQRAIEQAPDQEL